MNGRAFSRRAFLAGSVALAPVARALAQARAQAPDPHIEDLLRQMTLEEKAAQLTIFRSPTASAAINPQGPHEPTREEALADAGRGMAAGYFNGFDPAFNRALQQRAVEDSRLRIPLIFAGDVIHGLKTTFPIPLAEAASFDPELCRRTARASAEEASALGLHWTFAPMVDIARDERWGRVMEGAGEDPWLGARIAAARVRGFQGDDLRAENSLLACPKHFAGYGGVEGGMEYNSVEISETALRQVHLPPFEAAFAAGALTTMTGFNDVAGVPSTADRHLLTEILREEWRFPGLVVSDFQSVRELIPHGFAADEEDAVLKAFTAGCDVALSDDIYVRHLPALVRDGRLAEAALDQSVRRMLRLKKASGLFANPYRSLDPGRAAKAARRPEALALARETARKSIVLLKNENNQLPLPKTGKSLAFIGPFVSDKDQTLGNWSLNGMPELAVSLEEGVRAALSSDARCTFTPGCAAESEIPGGIEAAVQAAREADIAVLYLGETGKMSGESAATTSIVIPHCQQALAEAVAATGRPLVVILKHGRALALQGAARDAPAVLCSWFLGSESGRALADIVFGDFAPQGRLPVSFPRAPGQEPFYYDHRPTGRPQIGDVTDFTARYREVANEPLFAFGHGLTFSVLDYGETKLSAPRLSRDGALKISARIVNRGGRAAHEVAQLYIHRRVAAITQPVRQLKGVQHVALAPGETKEVVFELRPSDLAYVQPDLSMRADAGLFDIWIAPSAVGGQKASFSLD
ncbi:glycoside hydrolase family 3 N-terminal domain-containing protein [Rhodoblastus sp.]|uniref:glycoside hydrolase family 3 N-terminal domain-containing protein n=1 Tax=Rhodoblastus sp. TaxID=1962975 RepID=UPI003F96197B